METEILKLLEGSGNLTIGVIAYMMILIRKDLAKINLSIAELKIKHDVHTEKIQDVNHKLEAQESYCDRKTGRIDAR